MKAADFIRPSAIGQLAECPGAAHMQARAVAMVPALLRIVSVPAEMGTKGHAVIASVLGLIYHGPGPTYRDPDECLAMAEPEMAAMSEWDRETVRRCVRYAVALIDRYQPGRSGILIEHRLPGTWVGLARGGTADLVIVAGRTVIVVDHKLGFIDQGDAADHEQTATYAAMAWDAFQAERVEVHLAQGRLSRERRFTAATYDAATIDQARAFAVETVATSIHPHAPLRPCIKACRYCKALVVCRAAREHIMNANDELAMFGAPTSAEERVRLAEAAQIAARFAATVKDLQKLWVVEQQAGPAAGSAA